MIKIISSWNRRSVGAVFQRDRWSCRQADISLAIAEINAYRVGRSNHHLSLARRHPSVLVLSSPLLAWLPRPAAEWQAPCHHRTMHRHRRFFPKKTERRPAPGAGRLLRPLLCWRRRSALDQIVDSPTQIFLCPPLLPPPLPAVSARCLIVARRVAPPCSLRG